MKQKEIIALVKTGKEFMVQTENQRKMVNTISKILGANYGTKKIGRRGILRFKKGG